LNLITPEAALVYNLNCPDYVEITCGTLERLHEAFAKLDIEKGGNAPVCNQNTSRVSGNIISLTETASLPTDDRKLIRSEQMHRRIFAAAKSRATRL